MVIDAKACRARLGLKVMVVLGYKQRGEGAQAQTKMQTTGMSSCLQIDGNLE